MPAICLYFQIHQPYRLRRYTVFDLGQNSLYEDDDRNCDTLLHAARQCYLPMNDILLSLMHKHGRRFRVAFSISGTALDQFEQYAPEVIDSFKALADTGCVEFLAETYSHSLAFLYSKEEFRRQVERHAARTKELFGQTPRVFRHTELIYNNELAAEVEAMGFAAALAEGADQMLGWRSPNFVYQPANCLKLKLLLKNYRLSDDIALRFNRRDWDQWPLTADKFASWCHAINGIGETVNLFMHYETFGLTHPADSGIFQFMEALPDALLAHKDFYFRTPSEVAAAYSPMGRIDVPQYISWADAERDLNSWLGNDMQKDAIHALYELEDKACHIADTDLQRTWLRLQTADHFSYMCTKWFSREADIGRYTNPYGSPYDAYINYMNVLADFTLALDTAPVAIAPTPRARRVSKTATAKAGGLEAAASSKTPAAKAVPKKTAPKKAVKKPEGATASPQSADSPAPKTRTRKSKTPSA